MLTIKKTIILSLMLSLTACAVGPNYKRPPAFVPFKYKEAPKGWKIAKPQDTCPRGEWWTIFKDEKLNELEFQLNTKNQTIATAAAQYFQARALVDEARAAFFPTLSFIANAMRQKQGAGSGGSNGAGSSLSTSSSTSSSSSSSTTGTSTGSGSSSPTITDTHSLVFNGSWELDIWGSIRRQVEANAAAAQASAAQLAATRLSTQATLAQDYFQLRALDQDQKILNDTVIAYKKALTLTENRYQAGVAALSDVIQAKSQLETAQAQAINNKISRSTTEHAIAILVGVPPSCFSLPPNPLTKGPPPIPLEVPSALLERRPDVAAAERLIAEANAQVGVAISAYFPTLTLTGTASDVGLGFGNWFSLPAFNWAIGAELADTILDGGLRSATVDAARANYYATIATYRQTLLTAFQNVEDDIASLHYLKAQEIELKKAADDALKALQLIMNQYLAGTLAYSNVITAQTTAYTAQKNAADVVGLEMVAATGLITALGGGWDAIIIKNAANEKIHQIR